MPYNHLFETKPKAVPGAFRCRNNTNGLRVEVLAITERGSARMRFGSEGFPTIGVSKETAGVLRDFFTKLEEAL